MSIVTFEHKDKYEVGDVAYGLNLTPFMRCVGHNSEGEPLFQCIKYLEELGHPQTRVIPTAVCDAGKHFGSAHYDLYVKHWARPWHKYNMDSEPMTLIQARMVQHNFQLDSRESPHHRYETRIVDKYVEGADKDVQFY